MSLHSSRFPVTSHWYAPLALGYLCDHLYKPSMREDGNKLWGLGFSFFVVYLFLMLERLTYKHLLPSDLPNSPLSKPSSSLDLSYETFPDFPFLLSCLLIF